MQGHFAYNFTEPGEYNVDVSVIASFDNSSASQDVSLSYDSTGLAVREGRDKRPNKVNDY